jgi:hypothetical protein
LEEWRDIPGYEGFYLVSNFGNVKSLSRHVRNGKGKRLIREKKLHFFLSHGHPRVELNKEGHARKHFIHRLVYRTFIGEIPNGKEINHIDGIKSNNLVENLECVTRQQHHKRTKIQDLNPKGERHSSAKISETTARKIKEKLSDTTYGNYGGLTKLAVELGVSVHIIRNIKYGNAWNHV